jgi:hypothetical protein
MTLPITATNVARFVPSAFGAAARERAEAAGEADLARFAAPPTYLVDVPTAFTRPRWRHAVLAAGITYPSDAEMMAQLRTEVADALPADDPDRAPMLERIDLWVALGPENAPPALRDEIVRIERAVQRTSPTYAALVADRATYFERASLVGCQFFLRGRENPDRIFRRRSGLVTEEELAEIPPAELTEVGLYIQTLLFLSPAQEKNSAGPSPSPGGPTTSPAEPTPPTAPDGSSSESSSSATPAST